MNIKTIIWWVVATVVAVGAWWLLANGVPSFVPVQNPEDSLPYEVTTEGSRKYTQSTDTYSIEVTYPSNSDTKTQAAIDRVVGEEIARFKTDIAAMIDEEEAQRIREQGRPYELIISYKPFTSNGFTSYEFDIYLDTGGAHPNGFFRTLTVDAQGAVIELGDLFNAGAPYLQRLSEQAYAQVLAQLKERTGGGVTPDMEDTVRIGTSPTPETLQFFVLDGSDLVILIPPYQAASYAAGTFEVRIPLSSLRDILR